ncbi:TIR domain-containing protein [Cystobacter fuscus]|uniref:toll/interleukin-1 receptor domain-containing protein n=1 Tax=Cystobacter fuscus TaxID=43 RepID=UPI002B29EA7F|nr:TIR domain-containing protein [Cystobacter fuscus]
MERIFVSYRREDSPGHIGRLYDHLVTHFGEKLVFRDIETIEPGADFMHAIGEAVESSGVLLAVIGPQWLDARDKQGRRRLDNPRDFVRLEVAEALSRDVRVIPVLVGGATIPSEEELPPDLAPLARRNAIEISDSRFRTDMAHLIRAIQTALGVKPTPAAGAPRPGVQWRQWGAVGFIITFTVLVLSGILWVQGRAPKPTQPEGIGGAGDAGVAEGSAPSPVETEPEGLGGGGDAGMRGTGDAGMTGKALPISPPVNVPRKKKQPPPLPRDAGVEQPALEDAGSDAGVEQPALEDAGTDAGIATPPPSDAGPWEQERAFKPTQLESSGGAGDAGVAEGSAPSPVETEQESDAGVEQPALEDAGSDAGIATPPPWDEGAMDEDGGTGGSEVIPPSEPESSPQPETQPESPAPTQPEPEDEAGY